MENPKIHNYYYSKKKRLLDIFLAIIGLIVLIPTFIISYPILLLAIGSPIIFKQKRMGKDKKSFIIYKLRTMKIGSERKQKKLRKLSIAPYPMFKIKNDPRFNLIGKNLSQFGIDELPQIINILKGKMSFIGPRPLPVNEANKLPSSWNFRYNVRPGILSKWALSSKRYISLADWTKLEKKTLEQGSVIGDLKLIIDAICKLITK